MQINRIYLIVHPLFEQTRNPELYDEITRQNNQINKQEMRVNKSELHGHGRTVLKAAKDRGSLLVIIGTNPNKTNRQTKGYEKFIEWTKKTMKERFVELNGAVGFAPLKLAAGAVEAVQSLQQLERYEYSKSVRILASGQLGDLCVIRGARNVAAHLNKNQKIASIEYSPRTFSSKEVMKILEKARSGKLTEFRKWRLKKFGKRKLKGRGNGLAKK